MRRRNVRDLHDILQRWIHTFPTPSALDAQLDEVKLAFGVVRSTADFAASDWVRWWSAIEEVTDRWGNPVKIPGKPWRFSRDTFAPAKDASYRG